MNFKIDTKEKFYVVEPSIAHLTANMAEELVQKVVALSKNEPNNVILHLQSLETITEEAVEILANCRIEMYNNNYSFVVCGLKDALMEQISNWEMEDAINVTPTESEAWDIVQMDEIEREFLNGEEDD